MFPRSCYLRGQFRLLRFLGKLTRRQMFLPSCAMAFSTRLRVAGFTIVGVFSTLDTVWRETLARSATSSTVGSSPTAASFGCRKCLNTIFDRSTKARMRRSTATVTEMSRRFDRSNYECYITSGTRFVNAGHRRLHKSARRTKES